MDTLLHEKFLENETNYLECQLFWRKTLGAISKSKNQYWVRWMPQEVFEVFQAHEDDGDAIFDAKCNELDRGVSIHQHPFSAFDEKEGGGTMPSFSAWLKYYNNIEGVPRSEIDPRFPGHNLVLSLILSKGSLEIVKLVLSKWFDAETSIDEIEVFLKEQIMEGRILDSDLIRPFNCRDGDVKR